MLKRKPTSRHFDSLDEHDLHAVMTQYSVGDVTALHTLVVEGERIILLNEKSETSRKYVVDTTKGRFFLKEVPWYCDDETQMTFNGSLTQHLGENGLPVPYPIRTAEGGFYTHWQDAYFMLYQYIAGYTYNRSNSHVISAARTLAQIHHDAQQLESFEQIPNESIREVARQHLELALDVRKPPAEVAHDIEQLDRYLINQLPGDHDHTPVHGDYIPWNLAFSADGNIIAIYDFDNACYGSRLRDIGKGISSFFMLPYAGYTAILQPFKPTSIPVEEMRAFLTAYEVAYPLSGAERADLPAYVAGGLIGSILLSYIRGDQDHTVLRALLAYLEQLAGVSRDIYAN